MGTSLSTECKTRIENKVRELEKISSVEFVPVMSKQSSHYLPFRFALSLLCSLVALSFFHWKAWSISSLGSIGLSIGFGLLCFGLLSLKKILSTALPEQLKHEEVEEAARLKFLEHEVFATPQRSGVLIYISELEQSVYLLADKGIAAQISRDEITQLGETLAQDLGKNGSAETFLKALEELSTKLAPKFPPGPSNNNELGDHVRS